MSQATLRISRRICKLLSLYPVWRKAKRERAKKKPRQVAKPGPRPSSQGNPRKYIIGLCYFK